MIESYELNRKEYRMAKHRQFTIGKIVTPLHKYNYLGRSLILWSDTSKIYKLDGIADDLFYGEVAIVLAEDNKDGWIRLLSVRGKIGSVRCIDLQLIT